MARAIAGVAIAAALALAACVTTNHGYSICGKDYNSTCPNNTANVIVK
jgi:hypothetical protein